MGRFPSTQSTCCCLSIYHIETHYKVAWLETRLPAYNHVGWAFNVLQYGTPKGNRTPLSALKGQRPNR